jgi:hypothetical protein
VSGDALAPRRRKAWSRPLSVLWHGLRKDAGATLRFARRGRFDVKSLRQFSLALHGKDFVRDVVEASDAAGLSVFAMWGTLLGAVRGGGLLPHDVDIDFGIGADDYLRKDGFIRDMVGRGYSFDFDIPYKFRLTHPNRVLHADFDVFFEHAGQTVCLLRSRAGDYVGAGFPLGAFQHLETLTIAGDLDILVPSPPGPVLEVIYGPNWMTPDPHYRSGSDLANRVRLPPSESPPPLGPLPAG